MDIHKTKIVYFLFAILIIPVSGVPGFSQQVIPSVIPQPRHLTMNSGSFCLNDAVILAPDNQRISGVIKFFTDAVKKQTGIRLKKGTTTGNIRFGLSATIVHPEGYSILIDTSGILVQARSDTGLFWAVQTLRQLLPPDHPQEVYLPCLTISDEPSYAWRSNMLDVGRHFFPVAFIRQHIDLLSYYKYNIFHWHLTEDQGWRIEIKKYPDLTAKGAYRIEPDGSAYGGFYTQKEISELVQYAKDRNVTIVPEIEMPGHCLAALASYPELSCLKTQFKVASYWGVINDVYCAGQEETYDFITDVLDEVFEMFPSRYIHIGGDEVPKYRWQHCQVCQQKISDDELKDEHGLQSYFIRRIQKYLKSKNRVLIGWDEIMEGGVDTSAIIEVWRGPEKANEAISNQNAIIQTLYFDAPQVTLNLRKTFSYSPAVEGAGTKVLGAECPLWTEGVTTINAHYMLYPRIQAFSEALWNGATEFTDFTERLKQHYDMMDRQGILYGIDGKNLVTVGISFSPQTKSWKIQEQHEIGDLKIRYTKGNKIPDPGSPVFTDSLVIREPVPVVITAFRKDRQAMLPVRYNIMDHLAVGKKTAFKNPYHQNYSKAGDFGLTDGISGSLKYNDGTWLGWWGSDLDIIVDLDLVMTISSLQLNCMQQIQLWIMFPRKVSFSVSSDGKQWKDLPAVLNDVPDDDFTPWQHRFTYVFPTPTRVRFIHAVAENYGTLPSWHNGARENAWIFADEIIVQ